MRRSLEPLCRLSIGVVAFCLVMIAVMSVGQSIGRVVGITMNSTESVGSFWPAAALSPLPAR
ncbi:hypothetical protein SAMN04488245_11224 [Alloyangia pacifica]|uniref:Uncharacterized protein n=1 Tax=Alloyangia pacifica TaxID=311180 RepID=A0A1I6VMW9_9RHOB|nr:hypothetical protein SAMN04488245_11224 [Alloyangia pacifica]SFT14961.1 hypothetical protein SAMN04488050_11224 [Alloyangia pacifica]